MKFTQIPSVLNYKKHRLSSALASEHSNMISAFLDNGTFGIADRKIIVILINAITYLYVTGDSIPDMWNSKKPFDNALNFLDYMDSIDAKYKDDSVIGDLFVPYQSVDWSELENYHANDTSKSKTASYEVSQVHASYSESLTETPKENLWLKPRDIPRYVTTDDDAWLKLQKGDKVYTIMRSFPEVPIRQRDITVTTDVNRMKDADVDKLFPNQFIRTRKPCMYEPVDGVYMHEKLGLIPDIEGFTREQVIENVIQYPHLYIIRRVVDGAVKNFFADIEIDGVLHPIIDVWDTLPDTRILPKTKEFMQEYVIRRYLLERDIKHVEHKYPMNCDLSPYLTLFMPKNEYAQYGFTGIGRLHVKSRVAYLQSLNPILRSLYQPNPSVCVTECPFADQCTDQVCDGSCPKQAEFTYLLERNRIDLRSSVFQTSEAKIELAKSVLHTDKRLIVVESETTIDTSNLLTYIACCEKWRGNCLNCSVYHLNFSAHLDMEQQSWSMKTLSESFEYEKIWMDYAPILIISNFDYIQFKDFQAQTLLNLIHSRERDCKTTIIVSPKINNLVGKGQFFDLLKGKLREAVIR